MEILQRGRQRDWAVDLSVRTGIVGMVGLLSVYEPGFLGYGFGWTASWFVPSESLAAFGMNASGVAFAAALALIGAPLWILWWFGGSMLANECSRSLEKERAKSTLEFLLVTPISSESIIRAKLLGSLIPVGLMTIQYSPMVLLGIVWGLTMGASEWIVLLVVGVPYVASAILAAGCLTMAVSAMPYGRRRVDRSGWGSGLFLFVEVGMWILFAQVIAPFFPGPTGMEFRHYTFLSFMLIAHLVIATSAFRAALSFLQRLRSGDASFEPIVSRT